MQGKYASKTSPNVNLLLRYSDALFGAGDVIAKHDQVLRSRGSVWFGKVGPPIGLSTVASIVRQIADDKPTYLFLVGRKKKSFEVHRCNLKSISRDDSAVDFSRVPKYYDELGIAPFVKTWFEISGMEWEREGVLQRLKVRTGNSAYDCLNSSMSPVFVLLD